MAINCIDEYKAYVNKTGNRLALYREVTQKYNIQSALYPGSHIDIDPSLVIPKVIYVDNFKGAIKFFKNTDTIKEYLNASKEYNSMCDFTFIGDDYSKDLKIGQCDLIISQYAGFVGSITKQYLKIGGILLCNDSHGDATLAYCDDEFKLIGIVDASTKIESSNLDDYFKIKGDSSIDLDFVRTKMKGLKYIKTANNYIFEKIR